MNAIIFLKNDDMSLAVFYFINIHEELHTDIIENQHDLNIQYMYVWDTYEPAGAHILIKSYIRRFITKTLPHSPRNK